MTGLAIACRIVCSGLLTLASVPAMAQDLPATDAIVVAAQRSGAPMWTIGTARGTIILVGELRNVPKATPWFPDRLEEATAEAQQVILGTRPKVSPGDILRLIFRGGRFTRLPDKSVAGDYLDPVQLQRLAALEEEYDKDYARRSFLITAFDLLTRRLRFNRDTGDDATDVVRRAARRARVPTQRAGSVRGKDMLDNLAEADPRDHIACLEAAMTAAEIGPSLIEQRGNDWRGSRVAEVMANPLEQALGQCWPWADEDIGEELRGQWTDAIALAAGSDGVTLAVVPLRVLAEADGVLDQLELRGLEIFGPDWRPKSAAANEAASVEAARVEASSVEAARVEGEDAGVLPVSPPSSASTPR